MSDLQTVERLREAHRAIHEQLSQVIVGQQQVIEQILIALFTQGHCLLVGVPGLAKTLLIRTLAQSLALEFRRIQFTPDLMPSDITGTEVIQEDKRTGNRHLRFMPGPVFGNIILADEINRTPPKTQAALLEAMQEHQVTVGGTKHPVPEPFFVLATQNPIEQEGTYPLPEAQLDRFMFNVLIDYPSEDEELQIVLRTTADTTSHVRAVLSADEILSLARGAASADRRSHCPPRNRVDSPHSTDTARSTGAGQTVRHLGCRPTSQPVPGVGCEAAPSCRVGCTSNVTTCTRSLTPFCGIASARISMPRRKASQPTR